jgi:hypothetical protein
VRLAVKDELEKLSHVGGAVDPDRFGPRSGRSSTSYGASSTFSDAPSILPQIT